MMWRVPPAIGRLAGRPIFTALARSWRFEPVHEERWREGLRSGRPLVFMCWHEALLPLLWRHRRQRIAIVVSEARDGQYLADFAETIGYRLVRGSSTRGGARALLGAVRELEGGWSVAFTPDGPRGPHRELKPGVVAAAQRGGGLILPLHAATERAWRLRSWDRFMVPKPFAKVRISYGVLFAVGPGDDGLALGVARARASLEELVRTSTCPDAGVTPTG